MLKLYFQGGQKQGEEECNCIRLHFSGAMIKVIRLSNQKLYDYTYSVDSDAANYKINMILLGVAE